MTRQDLAVRKNEDGLYDLAVENGDFEIVEGFETSLLVSLFTDTRAPQNTVSNAEERRGWVGDIRTADIGRFLGSLLWLYEQARLDQDTLNSIAIEAEAALQWMIVDGAAQSVSVTSERIGPREVNFNIDIVGTDGVTNRYSVLWSRFDGAKLS